MLFINVDRFFVSLIAKWNASSVPLWAASVWREGNLVSLPWQIQQKAWNKAVLMLAQLAPHSYPRKRPVEARFGAEGGSHQPKMA
jgi:hypothetical protein